jgi:enterochelin esterase-like enzyme
MNNLSIKTINLNCIYGLFIVIFLNISLFVQGSILERHSVQSKILHQNINYSVLLPDHYYENQQKFPVIYLLHGIGGNGESWTTRCNVNGLIDSLKESHSISDFIYVMPDAQNSYYINNYDSSFCYEDFFVKEFSPFIDSAYRTKPNRENHALIGLSMGGFGAAILGVKHPDIFGSVIIMSGSLRDSAIVVNMPQEMYEHYYGKVIGHGLIGDARITNHWKQNSPYYLIDSLSAVPLRNTNWYIDCGISDSRLPANESFHRLLMNYQIPHELHIKQGGHNWEYWYKSTVSALVYLTSLQIK